jgi:hypothetical protein
VSLVDQIFALTDFGFTQRQAGFLVQVMQHAGVCLMRQYCVYAKIPHGVVVRNFFGGLVARRFATAYACARHNRGRIYHLHHKALYRAIGEPGSRLRRPAVLARARERLMLLDAVLAEPAVHWLGAEPEKVRHFLLTCSSRLRREDLPLLTFHGEANSTVRYFPDRVPIGLDREQDRHVFLYLVTRYLPGDFRMFLLRHAELFRALPRWVVRLLVPRPLQPAVGVYREAFRDELMSPFSPALVDELRTYFVLRRAADRQPDTVRRPDYAEANRRFRHPRFRALYRDWCLRGDAALYAARSPVIADAVTRGTACLECRVLPHVYGHLTVRPAPEAGYGE